MKKFEETAKKIVDDLNVYDPGSSYYDDHIKSIAAILDSACPEMEPVGWCVITPEGRPLCYTFGADKETVNENLFMRTGYNLDYWNKQSPDYTVEQVYRVKRIAELEENDV